MPLVSNMSALASCKVTPRAAFDAMTTGHRHTALEGLSAGLLDRACELKRLPDESIDLIDGLIGKDRPTLAAIKTTLFRDVVGALLGPVT
jgi:enoyl-CoA hydratase/carnithine racemase